MDVTRRVMNIAAGQVVVQAQLNDTKAAQAISDALPISSPGNTWGDEIYSRIPVDVYSRDLKEVVDFGGVAFWPPGNAFCILFGPTSASRGDEIRAASGVAVVGRIIEGAVRLREVSSGTNVTIERM